MRSLLCFVTVAMLALPAVAAQTDSGNLEVTAGNFIGYTWIHDNASSRQTDHTFFIGFSDLVFGLGYFADDNLAIGSTVSFNYSNDKDDGSDTNTKSFNLNPYMKFYVPLSDTLYWYISGTAGCAWYESEINGYTGSDSWRFSLGAGTGVTIMVTDYLGVYLGAYYNHFFNRRSDGIIDGDPVDDTSYDRVRATCGLTVFVGDSAGSGSSDSSYDEYDY